MLNINKLASTALAVSMLFSLSTSAAEQKFVSIGTGGVTGVYYPAGGAICRLMNKEQKNHSIRCSAESTGGSVYNINALKQKQLAFGIVQSDIQAAAYNGTRMFQGKPYKKLRAVFSLHPEPIHLMARKDSNIKTFDELKGKRVNIGNPGSGQRSIMELLMKQKGWTKDTFTIAAELKSSEQAQALCDGKFDATFWSAGLPNGSTQEATTTCDVTIVPMNGPTSQAILKANPAYSKAIIPGGMYRGNDHDIESFGPKGTLVTSTDIPDEVVYELVKAVFENFDSFKKLHPAFANLTPEEMIKTSLVAPLHPGAVKYYKEKGWL